MFYRRRASPKHRYDMTEVDYGGVGHRTWLRDPRDKLLCLWGAPAPVYKGARERLALEGVRQVWGVVLGLPSPSRIPLSFPEYERRKEGEREKEKRAAPLVQFGPEGGGRLLTFGLPPLFSYGPITPNTSPGVFP